MTTLADAAPIETAAPAEAVVMRFLTLGGAPVELHTCTFDYYGTGTAQQVTGYNWRCTGCDVLGRYRNNTWRGYQAVELGTARADANRHASTCRAMPKPSA